MANLAGMLVLDNLSGVTGEGWKLEQTHLERKKQRQQGPGEGLEQFKLVVLCDKNLKYSFVHCKLRFLTVNRPGVGKPEPRCIVPALALSPGPAKPCLSDSPSPGPRNLKSQLPRLATGRGAAVGSGPRHQILSHVFARCASPKTLRLCENSTRLTHGRRFFDSRNVQKSVTQIIYLGPLPRQQWLRDICTECSADTCLCCLFRGSRGSSFTPETLYIVYQWTFACNVQCCYTLLRHSPWPQSKELYTAEHFMLMSVSHGAAAARPVARHGSCGAGLQPSSCSAWGSSPAPSSTHLEPWYNRIHIWIHETCELIYEKIIWIHILDEFIV